MMYASARRRRADVLHVLVERGHAGITVDALCRTLLAVDERRRAVVRRDLRWLLEHGLVEAARSEYNRRGRRIVPERWYATRDLIRALG